MLCLFLVFICVNKVILVLLALLCLFWVLSIFLIVWVHDYVRCLYLVSHEMMHLTPSVVPMSVIPRLPRENVLPLCKESPIPLLCSHPILIGHWLPRCSLRIGAIVRVSTNTPRSMTIHLIMASLMENVTLHRLKPGITTILVLLVLGFCFDFALGISYVNTMLSTLHHLVHSPLSSNKSPR